MTSDSTNHEPSPLGMADSELEQLLGDAYDVPPVPRTLLKRLDGAIEEQWGHSPQLIATRWAALGTSLSRGRRWIRAASAVAVVAATVLLVVMLTVNSSRYAWADVLVAMARQGIVQIEGPEGVRWFSLADGVLGEQTLHTSRVVDVRRNVMLIHDRGEPHIECRTMPAGKASSDLDRWLVAFLRGGSLQQVASAEPEELRLVDESWTRRSRSGREEVLLQVQFATDAQQPFTLQLTLDPKSHLPLACQEVGRNDKAARLALSYPPVQLAELRARAFPADLEVVNVAGSARAPATATAAAGEAATAEITTETSAQNTEPRGAAAEQPEDGTDDQAPKSASLLGAASKWAPVEVTDRSSEETLARLDALLAELWSENHVEPTAPASDEELLRRVFLDLAGRTPTVSEVRAYLDDTSDKRYELLVERLLKSPDHASHIATVWRTFLIPEGVDLAAFGGVEEFDRWLAEQFANNQPYDEVVRDLLLAQGRLSRSGPLLFYSAVKLDPDQLASRTARVFLGMRLECAQCHDHPFEPWSQQDFWSLAAFFAQISRPQAELEAVSSVMQVRDVEHGEVKLPESETVVAPRFLDGARLPAEAQNTARRKQLAQWLTGAENPYFARATVNRVWGHLFGKGIVDPIDDFGVQHPPKSPVLLDLLASHFIQHDFNLRELFRTMVLSRAYRLSSGAETEDEKRTEWFAQMNVKMLTAEQIYDCITVATMLEPRAGGDPFDFQVARFGNSDRASFLQQFRTPGGRSTEYQGGIPQALTLMNGTLIEGATGLSRSGLLNSLDAPFFTNEQRVEVLYLATLSRRPRPSEWELLNSYIPAATSGDELKEGLADLLWALLNSAEFTMNH